MDKTLPRENNVCNYFKNDDQQKRNIEFTKLWVSVISQKENEQSIIFQSKNNFT